MVVRVLPQPMLVVLGSKHVRAHLEFQQERPANNFLNSKAQGLFGK